MPVQSGDHKHGPLKNSGTKDVLTTQERLVQAQSDAALLEQALNKGVAKERDATDAQKWFGDQVAQLRDDSEARVQLAEERRRELVGKLADLMEQRYRMEEEKARLIEDLDQLKGKLDDRERELAVANQNSHISNERNIHLQRQLEEANASLRGESKASLRKAQTDGSEQLQQLEAHSRELQDKCCLLERSKLSLEKECIGLQAALEAERREHSQGSETITDLLGQVSGLEEDLWQVRQSLAKAETDNRHLHEKLTDLEKERSSKEIDLTHQLKVLQQGLEQEEASHKATRARLADKGKSTETIEQESQKRSLMQNNLRRTKALDHLETLRRENKDLQVQLEREASRCGQLGAANAELNEQLASMQVLGRSNQHRGRRNQQLERSHQQLEDLLAELWRRAQAAGYADPRQTEKTALGLQTAQNR
ncbi:unnamed protein product [Lota lota]